MFDTKTPQQVRKLAKKSAWGAGLLTFFLTPVGYLYTGRKKLALITLVIWLPLILADVDDGPLSALLGFLIIGAPIENVMAIHKARPAMALWGRSSTIARQHQHLNRPSHCHIEQSGLIRYLSMTIGQEPHPRNKHHRELQPLAGVHGHQLDALGCGVEVSAITALVDPIHRQPGLLQVTAIK